MRGVLRQLQWSLLGLATCAWVFELTDLDLWVQHNFYNFHTGQWLLDRHNPLLRVLFYTGPKVMLGVFAVALMIALFASRRQPRLQAYRPGMLLVLLSLIVVPGVITSLKNVTNVACPADLQQYGGEIPYVKVLQAYPDGQRPVTLQRCFPAGHASGGYALLALAYLPLSRRRRRALLAASFAGGSLMAGYKMLIGHHFLSHTLVSLLLAWLLIHLLVWALPQRWRPPLNLPEATGIPVAAPPVLIGS